MAVVTIGHHPELTKEEVFNIFQRHFGDRYTLEPSLPRDHFGITKSGWQAVMVRLEQKPDTTKLVFGGYAPTWYARLVLGITFGALSVFAFSSLTNEVKTFIREAPEFQ